MDLFLISVCHNWSGELNYTEVYGGKHSQVVRHIVDFATEPLRTFRYSRYEVETFGDLKLNLTQAVSVQIFAS